MTAEFLKRTLVVCALALAPGVAAAQEASITGTITDATGAVLPGVTVVAVHEASGNQFEGVTDGRGVLTPLFSRPEYNNNLAFAPRTLQLGFRLTF